MQRLRVGIVGCGAIAQIQYLPLLASMPDRFEIAAICDFSADVLEALGDRYGVPPAMRFTSHADFAEAAFDAVIVCNTGSHAPPAIAAARAGKHLLVEKPLCTTREEGEALIEAVETSGGVAIAAYMKQHEPAFQFFASIVRRMEGIRFVQVNHLHPDNRVHLGKFALVRASDLSAALLAESDRTYAAAVARALGYTAINEVPAASRQAFFWVHNSMIHDVGNLTALFGEPERVVHTELWAGGNSISTTLEFANGIVAVCNWIDLPELPEFEETFAVYAEAERALVSFPTGFSIGQPSTVIHSHLDDEARAVQAKRSWIVNPFELELLHLHDCVTSEASPLTTIRRAVGDIQLVASIISAAKRRN